VLTKTCITSFSKHKRAGQVGSMFCCLQQLIPGRLVSTAEESKHCLSRPMQKKCSNMGLISISDAASKLLSQTYVICCQQNLVSGVLCDSRCTAACLQIVQCFTYCDRAQLNLMTCHPWQPTHRHLMVMICLPWQW